MSVDSMSQFTVDDAVNNILKNCLLHVGESVLSVRDSSKPQATRRPFTDDLLSVFSSLDPFLGHSFLSTILNASIYIIFSKIV